MRHPWQLSIEAEESGSFDKLRESIGKVVGDKDTITGAVNNESFYYSYAVEDAVDKELEAFLASDFVQQLAVSSLLYVKRVLNASEGSHWSYGSRRTDDGLFAAEVAAETMPHSSVDNYVLSGLLGYDLARVSKKLRTQMEGLDKSPLEGLILLGGLALVDHDAVSRPTSVSYEGVSVDGIKPFTKIGATHHGDFYTWRGQRFMHDAIDPTGVARPFAPGLPEKGIGAYHSSEPDILAAILLHQANRGDAVNLHDFFHKIQQRLETTPLVGGVGNFADYGEDSGRIRARVLAHQIADKSRNMELGTLNSFIMGSENHNLWMELVSTVDGIAFCRREGADIETIFTLPNNEIEDFIVTLFSSNFGRTSPSALYQVLTAINE